MNYIYLVKVFNINKGIYMDTLDEETIAICTDKNRAEEILKCNKEENSFELLDDKDEVSLTVKMNYCFGLNY